VVNVILIIGVLFVFNKMLYKKSNKQYELKTHIRSNTYGIRDSRIDLRRRWCNKSQQRGNHTDSGGGNFNNVFLYRHKPGAHNK
jgi:hypothetical protein